MIGDGLQDHQPMELCGIADLTSKLGAILHLYTAVIRKKSNHPLIHARRQLLSPAPAARRRRPRKDRAVLRQQGALHPDPSPRSTRERETDSGERVIARSTASDGSGVGKARVSLRRPCG